MKKLLVIMLVDILLASPAYNAFADMDYRCLNLCMSNGGTGYSCTNQCSYALPKGAKSSQLDKYKKGQEQFKNGKMAMKNGRVVTKKDPHKQFSDMYLDYRTLPPASHTTTTSPEKNYQCITQCQQSGMAYQMCQEQCVLQ